MATRTSYSSTGVRRSLRRNRRRDTVPATSAQAYYWGCTYSWEHVCFANYQYIHNLVSLDQNDAAAGVERAPENGYPRPSKGHPEHQVCGGVWAPAENRQIIGWSCAWGSVGQGSWELYGQPMLGGGNEGSMSIYQLVNEL